MYSMFFLKYWAIEIERLEQRCLRGFEIRLWEYGSNGEKIVKTTSELFKNSNLKSFDNFVYTVLVNDFACKFNHIKLEEP